jgi:hypothetical protein
LLAALPPEKTTTPFAIVGVMDSFMCQKLDIQQR